MNRIWEIENSPYEGPFTSPVEEYGDDDLKILILDQFKGRRPVLMDAGFLSGETYVDIRIVPVVILDSQIVSYLHIYLTNRESLKKSHRDAIEKLLISLVEKGCDYNPIFYYIESFAKNSSADFRKHVSLMTVSILRLQLMDEALFLRDPARPIVPDEKKLKEYLIEKNVSSLEQEAEARVESFLKKDRETFFEWVDATYATLLKIVLIHKTETGTVLEKNRRLVRFMTRELTSYMSRERFIALHYFCGLTRRFINVERNTNFEEAKRRLRATAWDLLLLRMPEIFLSNSDKEEFSICYVCTAENDLRTFAPLFSIARIFQSSHSLLPAVELNYSMLAEKLDSSMFREILQFDRNIAMTRNRDGYKLSNQRMKKLINRLENEMRRFCSSSDAAIALPCSS